MIAYITQLIAGIAFMAIPVVAQQWQYVAQDYHACATNGAVVVVVGKNGHILRSADTARTWTLPYSTTYNDLLTVQFVDEQTVLCGGSNGMLLRSTDAGATWNALPPISSLDMTTLVAVDSSTQYAITAVGMYRSSDKGNTWLPLPALPDTVGHAVFSTIADGVIVTVPGKIYHTADSSKTWTEVFSDTSKGLTGVLWRNSRYIACGKAGVLYISNDGKDWDPAAPVPTAINAKRIAQKSDRFVVVGSSVDTQGKDAIAYSSNSGFTWDFPNSLFRPYLLDDFRDVVILNDKTVVLCGDNSKLIVGDTGGEWRLVTQAYMNPKGDGKTSLMYGGNFMTKDTGIIVANVFSRGGWLRTTDRGITWYHDNGVFMDLLLKPEFFPYSKKIITVSFTYGNIYESFDFGKRWVGKPSARVPGKTGTLDIAWLNEQKALLVYDSLVYNTTDGGKSWQGFPLPLHKAGYVTKITFASEKVGYISGTEHDDYIDGPFRAVIFKTTNGGGTWRRIFERRSRTLIRAIAAGDEQTIAFGYQKLWGNGHASPDSSLIIHSTNAGTSWDSTIVVGSELLDMKFYSPDHAVAPSTNGMLYQSSDGGRTWSGQRVPDIDLPKHPHWYGSILSRDGKTLFLTGEGIMIRGELPQRISDVPMAPISQASPASLQAYFDEFSGQLNITIPKEIPNNEVATITVSDLLGKAVHQERTTLTGYGNNATAAIALPNISSGYYIIQVAAKEVTISGTVVLAR